MSTNGISNHLIPALNGVSDSNPIQQRILAPTSQTALEFDIDALELDPKTSGVLKRLQAQGFDATDLSSHLPKKLAGVLVLLYSHAGSLRVLLTTRSKSLRSHPGQTALPGGKMDEEDEGIVETAFREANEEVGLPFPSTLPSSTPGSKSTSIHTLCTLSPHMSQWGLVVIPVIAYLHSSDSADTFLRSTLRRNPPEVDRIFTHPLEAVLDPEGVLVEAGLESVFKDDGLYTEEVLGLDALVEKGSEDWPYEEELYNYTDRIYPGGSGAVYRMHRFRSVASPVKGLTADILIRIASLAYNKPPKLPIERYADSQMRFAGV